MPDLIDPTIFTHDPEIPEGGAALVFRNDGSVRIAHNIASVRDTGMMQGAEMAPVLMCLGALEVVNDKQAFEAAIMRAVAKLEQLEGPSPATTRN